MDRLLLLILTFCIAGFTGIMGNTIVSSGDQIPYSRSESPSEYGIFEQSIQSCGIVEISTPESNYTTYHKKDLFSSSQFIGGYNQIGFCFNHHNLPFLIRKDKYFLPVLRI